MRQLRGGGHVLICPSCGETFERCPSGEHLLGQHDPAGGEYCDSDDGVCDCTDRDDLR